MDETTQLVLSAINEFNGKLDAVKDVVAEFVADTRSNLATLNQWKRSAELELPDIESRLRLLENDRVTRAKLDELQKEVTALREVAARKEEVESLKKAVGNLKVNDAKSATKLRDKIVFVVAQGVFTTIVTLVVHYLKTH